MARTPAHLHPPLDFSSAAGIGNAVVELWKHRFQAEFDTLAAVALDPRRLVPVLKQNGISEACFEYQDYRAAFILIDHYKAHGARACGLKCVAWDKSLISLFDRFPPSQTNTIYHAAKLRELVTLMREAQQFNAKCRARIGQAIELARFGPVKQNKTYRGPGGSTGGDKHTMRPKLAMAQGVRISA
jgi:hypothetical protein